MAGWHHRLGLDACGEGERVLALESREGTRASRRVEESSVLPNSKFEDVETIICCSSCFPITTAPHLPLPCPSLVCPWTVDRRLLPTVGSFLNLGS